MTPALVRHDGAEFPLDTFIDAYRMVRVDDFNLPRLDCDIRIMTVDACGNVETDRRASEIDLRTVMAFRLIDGLPNHEPCIFCGTSDDDGEICDDCRSDEEGYW